MEFFAQHGWLGWIIVGGIAGAIAKLIMPGKDPGGIIVTIILGIVGAVLAGFLGQMLGIYGEGNSQRAGPGFIAAIVGALIVLAIYRMVAGGRRPM
jgi:uncharacterized membrane protein YeaQ/YmgE (transglycosylase-associated protein family)